MYCSKEVWLPYTPSVFKIAFSCTGRNFFGRWESNFTLSCKKIFPVHFCTLLLREEVLNKYVFFLWFLLQYSTLLSEESVLLHYKYFAQKKNTVFFFSQIWDYFERRSLEPEKDSRYWRFLVFLAHWSKGAKMLARSSKKCNAGSVVSVISSFQVTFVLKNLPVEMCKKSAKSGRSLGLSVFWG